MQFGLAPGFNLELKVDIWSSRFMFGAHSFDLELMDQWVSITSFFGHAMTRVFGHATGSGFYIGWECNRFKVLFFLGMP